jgi:superfamily II DNA/RNA helicase
MALYLTVLQHGDMNAATKLSALNRFRSPAAGLVRQLTTKILVVYDVQVKNPEIPHVPLIINYGEFTQNLAPRQIMLIRSHV